MSLLVKWAMLFAMRYCKYGFTLDYLEEAYQCEYGGQHEDYYTR